MSKRFIITFVLIFLGIALFASGFSFTLVPTRPLYKESLSDPYAFLSRLNVQKAIDSNLRPSHLRASVKVYDGPMHLKTEYIDLPYDNKVVSEADKYSTYLHMRMGLSTSLLRLRYEGEVLKSLDFEISLGAALNTIFNIFSNSNALDFDGTWFLGPALRINDRFVLRAGMHHFSGHYGDETLDKFYQTNRVDFSNNAKINADFATKNASYDYYLHNLVEYVRDNFYLIGTSIDLPYGFRAYGEVTWPFKNVWLRPFASTPIKHKTSSGSELIEYVGSSSEGFTESQVDYEINLKSEGFYNALRCHFGLEYFYEIKNLGTLFLSFDLQLHQDGQTLHMPGKYQKDNPWEKEYTISAGLELGEFAYGKNIRLEVVYHDGRVSGTNFFYQRTKTVSFGFSVS